jgi:deazaflavin-dependent oxidoreductase (nitroreductase family)
VHTFWVAGRQGPRRPQRAAELGHYLGQARERAELTRREVGAYFGVPVRYVELIEEGDFQALPDPVHARGYVRSLAGALGLDEEGITLAFTRLVGRACVMDRSLVCLRDFVRPVRAATAAPGVRIVDAGARSSAAGLSSHFALSGGRGQRGGSSAAAPARALSRSAAFMVTAHLARGGVPGLGALADARTDFPASYQHQQHGRADDGSQRRRRRVRLLQRYLLNPPMKLMAWAGLLPGHVLIETRGRRTGKRRRNVVGMHLEGTTGWVVAEHGRHAGYVRNLAADPDVRVRIGRSWRPARAHVVDDDDPQTRLDTFGRHSHAAAVRRFWSSPRSASILATLAICRRSLSGPDRKLVFPAPACRHGASSPDTGSRLPRAALVPLPGRRAIQPVPLQARQARSREGPLQTVAAVARVDHARLTRRRTSRDARTGLPPSHLESRTACCELWREGKFACIPPLSVTRDDAIVAFRIVGPGAKVEDRLTPFISVHRR